MSAAHQKPHIDAECIYELKGISKSINTHTHMNARPPPPKKTLSEHRAVRKPHTETLERRKGDSLKRHWGAELAPGKLHRTLADCKMTAQILGSPRSAAASHAEKGPGALLLLRGRSQPWTRVCSWRSSGECRSLGCWFRRLTALIPLRLSR